MLLFIVEFPNGFRLLARSSQIISPFREDAGPIYVQWKNVNPRRFSPKAFPVIMDSLKSAIALYPDADFVPDCFRLHGNQSHVWEIE